MTHVGAQGRRWLIPAATLVVGMVLISIWFGDRSPVGLVDAGAALGHLALLAVALVLLAQVWRGRPERVRSLGLALAVTIKTVTIVALIWALTHPTGFGPRTALDWVPIGMVNAGGGLWLLQVIRTRGGRSVAA